MWYLVPAASGLIGVVATVTTRLSSNSFNRKLLWGLFSRLIMRLIENYIPPTPAELEALKTQLGYTGNQMADLAGVASNSQWRKYTGGVAPRTMSPHILFFIAAQLTLDSGELNKVLEKMSAIGAKL